MACEAGRSPVPAGLSSVRGPAPSGPRRCDPSSARAATERQRTLRGLSKPAQTSTTPSMGVIRTNAAAAMLGVSPNTLRSWERRFGFPEPRRTAGGHRQFDLGQIEALRAAFEETHNVSSAIAIARERGTGPASRHPPALRLQPLRRGRGRPHPRGEPRRPLARAHRRGGPAPRRRDARRRTARAPSTASPGAGPRRWLAASMRVTPAATRDEGIVIFDASTAYDVEALYVQALELVLRRRGMRTLTISVALDPSRMARALHAVEPRAVVLAGHGADLDALGRLVFAARRIGGDQLIDLRLPPRAARQRREHRHAPRRQAGRRRRPPRRRRSTAARSGPPRRRGSRPSSRSQASARPPGRTGRRSRPDRLRARHSDRFRSVQDDAHPRRSTRPSRSRVAAGGRGQRPAPPLARSRARGPVVDRVLRPRRARDGGR